MKKLLYCAVVVALATACTNEDDFAVNPSSQGQGQGLTFNVTLAENNVQTKGELKEENGKYPFFWYAEQDRIDVLGLNLEAATADDEGYGDNKVDAGSSQVVKGVASHSAGVWSNLDNPAVYKATQSQGEGWFTAASDADMLAFDGDKTATIVATYGDIKVKSVTSKMNADDSDIVPGEDGITGLVVTTTAGNSTQTVKRANQVIAPMYSVSSAVSEAPYQSVGERANLKLIRPFPVLRFTTKNVSKYAKDFGPLKSVTLTTIGKNTQKKWDAKVNGSTIAYAANKEYTVVGTTTGFATGYGATDKPNVVTVKIDGTDNWEDEYAVYMNVAPVDRKTANKEDLLKVEYVFDNITFTLDGTSFTHEHELEILPLAVERSDYTAYLFVYFTGNAPTQEQVFYALSYDGFNYTPLNGGNPVIGADSIALKHSVRDPHILRGEDGMFYMVLTDMRSNEGWSSNDGLVLLKSPDLIRWTHTAIDFPTQWPDRFDRNALTQVWAPQTIYDPASGRYMVYYSIGEQGQHYKIYYSYANEDFTTLTEPQVLYDHGSNTIDGDIVRDREGTYHLFFKTEGEGNGIQQATAPSLFGPWTAERKYLQQTSVAVEGSGVFPLIDSQDWVLMYDCYTSGYYQFCTSRDLHNFSWVADTRTSGAFTPRHGTVIPITAAEQRRLTQQWPGTQFDIVPEFTPTGIKTPQAGSEGRTVLSRDYYTLQGLPLPEGAAPAAGPYCIEQTVYTDGTRESRVRPWPGR